MNRFIYFVVIVLFCIGFYGCETENLGKEQNNSFSKQPDNSYVQLLYDHFSALEDEEIFNELGIWGTSY